MKSITLYERFFLKILTPMQKGYLQVELPSGAVFTAGDKSNTHHADLCIKKSAFFSRIALYGDVGFAESYMRNEWETSDLTKLLSWFLLNVDTAPTLSVSKIRKGFLNIFRFLNKAWHNARKNSITGARKNITAHYDLSNDFFALFLDNTMTYSSAYFTKPDMRLEEAQLMKYENLCSSIKLKATDHVLEIGTGWGGFALYAAKKYGCRITTITISEQQYNYARQRISIEGLDGQIDVQLKDYRLIEGQYDKVVSIEMIEAVGARYLKKYFSKIHDVLKPNGVLGLQAIVCPDSRFDTIRRRVDFIQKHIFPGSLLPSVAAINKSVNATGDMFLFNMHDLGRSYAKTLANWRSQFELHKREIEKMGFDMEFIRKWRYYFSYCEAAFAMRNINVVQMVYTRPNNLEF
ncbi:MAG: class I SAM-dependent methyltransferase [Chitinophagales bacterium]